MNIDSISDLIDDSIGALCVSRPTNPTGNVLTDSEVQQLTDLSRDRGIPLILDNAYGLPFPGIVFTEATPHWQEHMIVCMSLSKLGLPAVRTGIVVASEEIVRSLAQINAITGLAPGGVGPHSYWISSRVERSVICVNGGFGPTTNHEPNMRLRDLPVPWKGLILGFTGLKGPSFSGFGFQIFPCLRVKCIKP